MEGRGRPKLKVEVERKCEVQRDVTMDLQPKWKEGARSEKKAKRRGERTKEEVQRGGERAREQVEE